MAIKNRYEFMYYVACTNCNPNGDPDMGNTPPHRSPDHAGLPDRCVHQAAYP